MPDQERKYVSNSDLQLELKALRSDFKVWLIVAIIGNQLISQVTIPESVSVTALLALTAKIGWGLFARS